MPLHSIALIGLPYQFGRRVAPTGYRMAAGPEVLLEESAVPAALHDLSDDVTRIWLDGLDDPAPSPTAGRPLPPGDQMIRQLVQNTALAAAVRQARSEGRLPVCFSGGCNSSIGVVSGLDDPELGMFWFDAHADDETPESSPDGLFEGMPVAVIAGECWRAWRESIEGFRVIPAERIAQVGLHDPSFRFDPARRAGVGHLVDPVAVRRWGFEQALLRARDEIASRADRVHVHIDVDVIDSVYMRGNLHAAPGGPSPEQLIWAVERIAEAVSIEALNFTAFDAGADPRALGVLVPTIRAIIGAVQSARATPRRSQSLHAAS